MTDSIDITGLDKAAVLASLFNSSAPQGMGFLDASSGPDVMQVEDARTIVESNPSMDFDYLMGRPLKVNLSGVSFNPGAFDRDNGGPGSARRVINRLRATGKIDTKKSSEDREALAKVKAHQAMQMVYTPVEQDSDAARVGGHDVGAVLEQAVNAYMNRTKSV